MNAPKVLLRFFLDEGVPDSVGRVCTSFAHEVIYLRDAIATGSPDELVCTAAQENDAILVACDGDMRQLAKKYGFSNSRYKKLNLIKISTTSPRAASRMQQAMSLIEHEWKISEAKMARRLYVEVSPAVIRTYR